MAHDPGGDQPPRDRTDYDHCPLYALAVDDERDAAELGGASRDPDPTAERYPA